MKIMKILLFTTIFLIIAFIDFISTDDVNILNVTGVESIPIGPFYCQARCLASCLEKNLAPTLEECAKFCPKFDNASPCVSFDNFDFEHDLNVNSEFGYS